MDGPIRVQSSQRKSKVAVRKNFSECALPPMKALLQSEKELCTLSTEELKEEQDNFSEVTFLCFEDDTAAVSKELAAISGELPDLLQSLHLCTLHENEVIFLKDLHKPMETIDSPEKKNYPTRILCAMRLSPSFPKLGTDSVFTLLNKYTVGIRCTMEMYSLQKHLSDLPHTEEDDTNQSVSSIEDDFVTALEHLDEDEPTKMIKSGQAAAEKRQDVTSQITSDNPLESVDEKIVLNSWHWKPSVKSSFVNILELKELPSPVRNSVTTSISDPWIQRSFFRSRNPDHSTNFLHKTLFSSSPAESSESDCSSPSPVIFLDEEGYQKSMKAKLQLPKIPVMKDGIEDSDSEVSEFFDSFDQFDEQEQTLESGSKHARNPVMGNASENKIISYKKSRSARITMNPQKFKFDRLVLPANVRKPTPRKPKSPYSNLLDIPDSPHPVKTPGDDSRCLFSPIRSSAFSPLGSCFSTECLCQTGIKEDGVIQNHNLACHTYSEFANNFSFEILSSVFNSQSSSVCKCAQDKSNSNTSVSKEEKHWTRKGQNKEGTSKSKSLMVKDHIQKFASELVEKSFGHAFKDLQKGVSTCTNALCHLAAKLTSLIFQMAFYEIGRQQALSLKKRAVNGLAGLLVSEAITGALKELQSVKQQIFTNTVAKFAAGLAEELIFEGIMEVCQFSYPSTPATCQNGSFHYNDNVVQLYAKDLSESVIQEAFIELSQVDVTFTTQAAISISVENIKYVSATSTSESTQLSNASTEFQDNFPLTLIPVQEYRKEYTVHKALLYTSSIASSIPVPIAGSILSQNQILYADLRVKNHSTPDSNIKCCKESQELVYSTKKRQGEVTSVRNIYLTTDNSPDSECNAQILYKQSDFKQASNPEAPKFADLTGTPNVSSFSGTMVDMIVSEAYEAVTSSKVSKSARQYTNKLKMEKMPYLQCIGEDTCKNMFANYLSKRIVKHSADETRSACSATSEKLAYCVGLGSNAKSRKDELPGSIKQSEKTKTVPVIVGQQQMPLNSSSKFHGNPVYSSKFVLSGSKDCVQEKKKLVACRPLTCKSSPASAVNFVKHMEELPDPESCSAKPISHPLSTCNMYNTSGSLTLGPERALDADTSSSVTSSCEDTFQIEDKSTSVRDGSLCGVPNTPPPTPLMPSQASSEWNLRKLTKKLKGELAKEFAPATPPSTPYRSEGDGLYGHESHDLGKEEFMLKLMRSLSEEVESSEDEENSETVVERIKLSVRTAEYADRLAASIISMATEKAASNLDKAVQMENYKYSPVNIESKRCHYTTFMNVPEKNIHSLWVYAGDMAGKLIREAKKMVESRHCNAQKLKQFTYQANGYHRKRRYHECWAKDRLKDRECFTLSLPTSLETPGLTSKYPSCESVTDEYADHIIQILKREGGHSELIMDQFASRLAYRSIKSGMQQAARKLRIRYNRKIASTLSSKLSRKLELFEIANNNEDIKKYKKGNCHQFEKQSCGNKYGNHRTECSRLIDFSESLACNITSDVRRKLMSAACLPKSLTDSCLYEKSEVDEISDFKTPFSRMLSPLFCKQKLYHSTGSLNEPTNRDDIINAIEQYAGKVVDDTLGLSLESAALHTSEKWTNGDRSTYAEKLSPFSATACTYCSMREHQYCTDSSYLHLAGQERRSKFQQITNASEHATCPKSNVLHLDIPKIHIDMDDKVIFADSMVAAAFDKAGRQLSNTSLTADSGIGQDGVSFAESLTTEILTSCMTRIGPAVKISSMGKEGFNSAESIVSQQMSLSNGDDSTGSWSNLSFEDEHPDENSSFLHLSDSNGNSSSWSSLGLEGDMYEENLSFPTSDSDGTEEKEDDLKDNIGGLGSAKRTLVIINLDIGSHMMDSQLRMALQWLIASETDVAELHFHNDAPKEFVILSKRLQERGWKVGDLFQAVLKYCEVLEKADGERALENRTFFGWLQEHV